MLHYFVAGESVSWPGFFFALARDSDALSSIWELRQLPSDGGALLRGSTEVGTLQLYVSPDRACELAVGGLRGTQTYSLIDAWHYEIDAASETVCVFQVVCPQPELRVPRYRPEYPIHLIKVPPDSSGVIFRMYVGKMVHQTESSNWLNADALTIGEVAISIGQVASISREIDHTRLEETWWAEHYRRAVLELPHSRGGRGQERVRRRSLLIGKDLNGIRYYIDAFRGSRDVRGGL